MWLLREARRCMLRSALQRSNLQLRGKGRGGVVQVTRVQQGVCVVRRLPVTLRHSRTTRSISM